MLLPTPPLPPLVDGPRRWYIFGKVNCDNPNQSLITPSRLRRRTGAVGAGEGAGVGAGEGAVGAGEGAGEGAVGAGEGAGEGAVGAGEGAGEGAVGAADGADDGANVGFGDMR